MFKRKNLYCFFVFILALTMLMPTSAFASADNPTSDVIDELQKDQSGPLSGIQSEVKVFSRDIFNIVRLVVVAILVISFFTTLAAFVRAGDNVSEKARLKSKLIWIAAGLILAINFWRVIELFGTIGLFSGS